MKCNTQKLKSKKNLLTNLCLSCLTLCNWCQWPSCVGASALSLIRRPNVTDMLPYLCQFYFIYDISGGRIP